jgi:hypothetical protein
MSDIEIRLPHPTSAIRHQTWVFRIFTSSLFISTGSRIFTVHAIFMLRNSIYNVTAIATLVVIVVVIIIPALHGGGANV